MMNSEGAHSIAVSEGLLDARTILADDAHSSCDCGAAVTSCGSKVVKIQCVKVWLKLKRAHLVLQAQLDVHRLQWARSLASGPG
jgi:hypothetical protein